MKTKKIIGISSAIGVGATLIATTATLTSCSTITKAQAAQNSSTNDNIIKINTSLANKIRGAIQNFVSSNGGKITQGQNDDLAKVLNDAFAKEFKGLIQQVDVSLDDNTPALATVRVRINAQSDLSIQAIDLPPNSKFNVNDDLKSFDVLDIITTVNQEDFLNLDAITLEKMNEVVKNWLQKLSDSNNVNETANYIKRDINQIIFNATNHPDPLDSVNIDLVHGTYPKQCTIKLLFKERVRYTGNSDFKFVPETNQTQLISTGRYKTNIDPNAPENSISITQDIANKIAKYVEGSVSTLDNIPGSMNPIISLLQLQIGSIPELDGKLSSVSIQFGNEQPKIADVTINFKDPVVTTNVTNLSTVNDFSLLYRCRTNIDPLVVPNSLKITPELAQKMDTVIQPVVDTMINESNLETIGAQIKAQLETIGEIANLVDKVKVYLLQGYPKQAKIVISFTEVVNTINVEQYSKPIGTAKDLETIKKTRINPNPPTVEATSFEINAALSEQIYAQMNSDVQALVSSMTFDKQQLINVFKTYLNKTAIGKYVKDITVALTSDQPAKLKVSIKFTKDVYLINVNKFVWDSSRQISAIFNTNVNKPTESIIIQGGISNLMKAKVETAIGSLTDQSQIPTVQETIKTTLNAIPEISNKVKSVGIKLGNENPAKATVSIEFTNNVIAYNLTQFTVPSNTTFMTIVQTTLNPPTPKIIIDKANGENIYATIKATVENETSELTTDANLATILKDRLNNISLLQNKIANISVKLTGNAPKVADITIDFNEDVELIDTGYFIKNGARQLNLRVNTHIGLTFIFNGYLASKVQDAVNQTINELIAVPPSVDIPLKDIKTRIEGIPELMNKIDDIKLRFNDDTPKKAIVDITFNCDIETRDANNFTKQGRVLTYTTTTKIGAFLLIDSKLAKQIYGIVNNIVSNYTTEQNPVDVQENIKNTLNNTVDPIKDLVSSVKVDFTDDIPKKANISISFNTNIQTQNADNWNRPGKENTITTTITTKIGEKLLISADTAKLMKEKIDGQVSGLTVLPNKDQISNKVKDALNSINELQHSISSVLVEFNNDEPKIATITLEFNKVPILQGQNIFTIESITTLKYSTPTQINPKVTLTYQTASQMKKWIDEKLAGLINRPNDIDKAAIESGLLSSFNGLTEINNRVATVSIDFDNGHPQNATVKITFLSSVNTVGNGIFTNDSNTTISYTVQTAIDGVIEITKDIGDKMKIAIDKVVGILTTDVPDSEIAKLNEDIKERLNAIPGIENKIDNVVLSFNKQSVPYIATVAINFNGQVNNAGSQYFATVSNTQLSYTRLTNINDYFVITQDVSNAISSTINLYLQNLETDAGLDQITKDNIINSLNQNPLLKDQIESINFQIDQNTRPKVINVDLKFKRLIKLLDQSHCIIINSNTIRYTVTTKIDPILHINNTQASTIKAQTDKVLNDIEKLEIDQLNVIAFNLAKTFNTIKGLEQKVANVSISFTNDHPKKANVLIEFTDYIQIDNNNVLTKKSDKSAELTVGTNIDAILEIDSKTATAIRGIVEKHVAGLTTRPTDLQNKEIQTNITNELNTYPGLSGKVLSVALKYDDNFPQGYTTNIKFGHEIRLVDQSEVKYVTSYEISVSGNTKINEKFDLNSNLAKKMYNKLYTMCNALTSLDQINASFLNQVKDAMNIPEFANNKIIELNNSTDQSEPRNITFNFKFNTQVNAVGQDKFSLVDKFTVATTLPTQIFVKTYSDGTFIYRDKLLTHAIGIERSKTNITDLYVPRNIRKLEPNVLSQFTNLYNVDMSDSILTDLPANLFIEQNHIFNVKLPSNLQTMAPGCLNNLGAIQSITWPNTLSRAQMIQGIGNANIYVPMADFTETNKTNVDGTPRNAITKTSDYAGQTVVLIGNDINIIGAWDQKNQNYGNKFLFNGSTNGVKTVIFQEPDPNHPNRDFIISRGTFNDMRDLKRVKLPSNLTIALDNTFNTLFNMEYLESEDGFARLEHLYGSMFNTMPLIQKLDFSNATKMENTQMNADFGALASLTTLLLPNQWTRLYGGGSFSYLTSVKKISMPHNSAFDPTYSTRTNDMNDANGAADFNVNFPRTPIVIINPEYNPLLWWDGNFQKANNYWWAAQIAWINGWVEQVGWWNNQPDHNARRVLFERWNWLSYIAISTPTMAMKTVSNMTNDDNALIDIYLPLSTESVNSFAFNRINVNKVYLPDNVQVLKENAFTTLSQLKKLVLLRESGPQWLDNASAFNTVKNLNYNNVFSNYKIRWNAIRGDVNNTNKLYYDNNTFPIARITTNAINASSIDYSALFDEDKNTNAIVDIPSYTNGTVEFILNANKAINIGTMKFTDGNTTNQKENPYSATLYAQVEGEWVMVGAISCWWGTLNEGGWVKDYFPNDIWSSKFKVVLTAYDGVQQLKFGGIQFGG